MRRKEQEGLEGRQEELGKVKTHKGVVLSDTPQGLGFPCGSAGKESACSVEDQGLIPGLGIFWAREFHGLHSPWGCKELYMSERL